MIYRSQDKSKIFCFGRGCSIEAYETMENGNAVYNVSAFIGNEETETWLGTYLRKDCALLAIEKMLCAIGEEGKMDVPSEKEMEQEPRIKSAMRREYEKEQRASGTPLSKLVDMISGAQSKIEVLEENGIFTVEKLRMTDVDTITKFPTFGKVSAGKVKAAADEILNN